MQDTVQTPPATFTAEPPAVEPRTITYPVRSGGSLTSTCPAWCTYDHTDDVALGIEPQNLYHHGDKIGLEYSADGLDLSILDARLVQWPFDSGDDAPYIEFIPEGSTAVSLPLSSPLAVSEEIRKVRGQLRALEELADKLAQAQADYHQQRTGRATEPWGSLSRTDLQSMPIAYLLKVFGVTVVESDEPMGAAGVVLGGKPGDMLLIVRPDLPQHVREDETRSALLADFEDRLGGQRV